MEPDQVSVVTLTMLGDSQEVIHALEPRLTRQIVRDIGEGDRINRIHHDVAVVHAVAATHLHVETCPDAKAASDSPAPDSLAKAFGEHHLVIYDVSGRPISQ